MHLSTPLGGIEGQHLQSSIDSAEANVNALESSSYPAANRSLADAFLDAFTDFGEDGTPVSKDAFIRAQEFMRQCQGRFPAPFCGATPTGSLFLEWIVAQDRRFAVSISEEDKFAFAGLTGALSYSGTDIFVGDVPETVWLNLDRLYRQ